MLSIHLILGLPVAKSAYACLSTGACTTFPAHRSLLSLITLVIRGWAVWFRISRLLLSRSCPIVGPNVGPRIMCRTQFPNTRSLLRLRVVRLQRNFHILQGDIYINLSGRPGLRFQCLHTLIDFAIFCRWSIILAFRLSTLRPYSVRILSLMIEINLGGSNDIIFVPIHEHEQRVDTSTSSTGLPFSWIGIRHDDLIESLWGNMATSTSRSWRMPVQECGSLVCSRWFIEVSITY